MKSLFSSNVLFIIFICVGSTLNKRHQKKNRIITPEELSVEEKKNDSPFNHIPIIVGLKKAIGPVEGMTKLLAEVSEIGFGDRDMKDETTVKSESGISFLQISQTDYPHIFYRQKSGEINSIKPRSNEVFYPFGNLSLEPMINSILLESNFDNLKLKDALINYVSDDKLNDLISLKHKNPDHSNRYNYVIPTKRKNSKITDFRNKKRKDDSHIIPSLDSRFLDPLIFDFLSNNKSKGIDDSLFHKPSILSAPMRNNNPYIPVSSKIHMTKSEEAELDSSTASLVYYTVKPATLTKEKYTKISTVSEASIIQTVSTAIASSENQKKMKSFSQGKKQSVISGLLDDKNSLNLQISLSLKVNNNSFSLVPTI